MLSRIASQCNTSNDPSGPSVASFRLRFGQALLAELTGCHLGKFFEEPVKGGFGVKARLLHNLLHIKVPVQIAHQDLFCMLNAIVVNKINKMLTEVGVSR